MMLYCQIVGSAGNVEADCECDENDEKLSASVSICLLLVN